jgi:spermidine/putrescine-binding protein
MRTRPRTLKSRSALVAAFVGLTLAACGGTSSTPESATCEPGQTAGDLLLYKWNDYNDPGIIEDFEAEFAVSVVEDFYPSNEEMLARVAAGGAQYDVVVPSD